MNNAIATVASPYVGPRPFERQDSGRFFGRERETNELLSLVVAHRVSVLYAPSGAGKTSLLKAGLIPRLEDKGFEVLPPTRVLGPTESDKLDIANIYAFQALAGLEGEEADPAYLAPLTIADYLNEQGAFLDKYGLVAPRVLIFDQFEELFTAYPARWEERETFFRQLQDALEAVPLLRIIFSLREDYLAQLEPYAPTMPDNLRHRFRLERMTPEAALTAVRGPLQNTGRSFTDRAAEKLIEELQKIRVEGPGGTITAVGKFIEPVQLQVVCQNLWQSLPTHITTITEKELAVYGDVTKALSQFYVTAVRQTIKQPDVKTKEGDLRDWFEKQLITPAETRSIVFQDKETGLTGGIPNEAIRHLDRQHIIRGEVRSGSRWYELTHDRFIDPILKANQAWREEIRAKRLRLGGAIIGSVVVVGFCFLVSLLTVQYFNSLQIDTSSEQTIVFIETENSAAGATATAERATAIAVGQTRAVEQAAAQTAVAQQSGTATAVAQNNEVLANSVSNEEAQENPDLYLARAETLFPTWTADERLESLVILTRYDSDNYTQGALELFYSLDEVGQQELFRRSANTNSTDLATLIEQVLRTNWSLSTHTENTLLESMEAALLEKDTNERTSDLLKLISLYTSARVSEANGQFRGAVSTYTSLIESEPTNPLFYLERGHSYASLDNADAAVTDFIQVVKLLESNEVLNNPPVWDTGLRAVTGEFICAFPTVISYIQEDVDTFFGSFLSDIPQSCISWMLVWPTESQQINQPFGVNTEYYSRFGLPGHEGIDIEASFGSNIYAVADGVVDKIFTDPQGHSYGLHIYIRHQNGYRTLYSQLSEIFVDVGQTIEAGDVIGLAGSSGNSTGPHLHFGLYLDGATANNLTAYPIDIIDPTPFLTPLMLSTEVQLGIGG